MTTDVKFNIMVCNVTNYTLFARCWTLHSQMHDCFKCVVCHPPVATLLQSRSPAHNALICPCLYGGEYRFCLALEFFLIAN